MLAHFFESIEDKFNDSDIISKIKDYSDKLTELDDSTITKLAKESITIIIGKERTLTDRYDSLNKAILRSGKRLIVFVDDLDRLMADELISVIRLIRNTADFNNTFFIAAFDQNYVLNTLASIRSSNNKENFLQKVFQLEISLPPIRKSIVEDSLKEYLKLESMSIFEKNRFEQIFPNPDDNPLKNFFKNTTKKPSPKVQINQFLYNIRDVKRFINSFQLAYMTIGNEVDLYDLFTIELIKYRFPSVYSLISEEKVLTQVISGNTTWRFSEEDFDKYVKEDGAKNLNIAPSKIDFIKNTLNQLFDLERVQTSRAITRVYNFNIYFFYQLSGSISISNFNIALKQGKQSLGIYFKKTYIENKIDELLDYIDMIVAYDNSLDFQNIIHNLLQLKDHNKAILYATALVAKKEFNISTYFDTEEEYSSYIRQLLTSDQFDYMSRAQMAFEFLKWHLRNEEPKILTEIEIKDILLNILRFAINNVPTQENEILILYSYNWDRINEENRKITFNKNASNALRSYLDIHKVEFLKYIIRSKYVPTINDEYVFDPLIPSIFGSFDEFEKYLFDLKDSPCKKYLLEKFSEYKSNNYQFVTIKDFETNPCKSGNF